MACKAVGKQFLQICVTFALETLLATKLMFRRQMKWERDVDDCFTVPVRAEGDDDMPIRTLLFHCHCYLYSS